MKIHNLILILGLSQAQQVQAAGDQNQEISDQSGGQDKQPVDIFPANNPTGNNTPKNDQPANSPNNPSEKPADSPPTNSSSSSQPASNEGGQNNTSGVAPSKDDNPAQSENKPNNQPEKPRDNPTITTANPTSSTSPIVIAISNHPQQPTTQQDDKPVPGKNPQQTPGKENQQPVPKPQPKNPSNDQQQSPSQSNSQVQIQPATSQPNQSPTNVPMVQPNTQSYPQFPGVEQPDNPDTNTTTTTAKDAPPIYNSDSSSESNKTGLIVVVVGFFAVIFGVGLFIWIKDMRRNRLEIPEIGTVYSKNFNSMKNASSTSIGAKTIDFDKPNTTIPESLTASGSRSMTKYFTLMKNTFSKKKKEPSTNYVPSPINMELYMRAVGFNWPSENDQVYYPPPGSLIADGNEQYYIVENDGYAYPIDTKGRVMGTSYPVINDIDAANSINSVNRNAKDSFGSSIVEDLHQGLYPYNNRSTPLSTGFMFRQSLNHNNDNYRQNPVFHSRDSNITTRSNCYEYSVEYLRSASRKEPVIVQFNNEQDHISYYQDKFDEGNFSSEAGKLYDPKRFGCVTLIDSMVRHDDL